ncbi:hypothetical protein WICMUC_004718 [Wickerhamomyces mucosus]|uniref:RFX-type winged-helix domain-containing protein n=1 Tax=Wickerhamomyces mucosus TaxID=1378264 RepID=A0A9P8PFX6_9ASCO|nr:hypothetical protein WICMUC_004718 [Wickerhamomyces mucosus]
MSSKIQSKSKSGLPLAESEESKLDQFDVLSRNNHDQVGRIQPSHTYPDTTNTTRDSQSSELHRSSQFIQRGVAAVQLAQVSNFSHPMNSTLSANVSPSTNSNYETPKKGTPDQITKSGKHTTTPSSESQKKKIRRSDHSLPGDDGDLELKNLATKALSISLNDFALQINSSSDPTPDIMQSDSSIKIQFPKSDTQKERQRQVFGLTWLLRSCDHHSSSVVPRNRIYTRYVNCCTENGLKPLSPASFGKLVRIIFPNLTTRRLGMRGQSKYHYCGLRLIGDDSNNVNSPSESNVNTPLHINNSVGGFESSYLSGTPYGSNSPASLQSQTSTPLISNTNIVPDGNIGAINSFLKGKSSALKLKFQSDLIESINQRNNSLDDASLEIPSIRPYLQLAVDKDVSDNLYALYNSYCSSIFESLRYMQLKKLFNILATFESSLPSSVMKLYTSESVIQWIIDSDRVTYKSIIKMLANLALQEIPHHVLQQLKQVSITFPEKVSSSLTLLPTQLVLEKLALAKHFSQLIARLVRVAETAQSASRVLTHNLDRELMYEDWCKYVNVDKIALKELPCDGENYRTAVEILQVKVPELLKREMLNESVITEWGIYISKLPHLFRGVPPRLYLLCTSALLTSALREISLAGGGGFGAWWVTRCWIDEWVGWCAELGGFLDPEVEAGPLLTNIDQNQISSEGTDKSPRGGEDEKDKKKVDLMDSQFGSSK